MSDKTNTEFRDHLLSLDRRSFMMLLASAAASYPLTALTEKRESLTKTDTLQEPWQTLAAVQQHLFPADDNSPGANDIQALAYLQHMLQAPDMDDEERDFIHNGVNWLNDIARKNKASPFIQLDENDREQVLRQIEKSRAGSRWLSLMLTYILEALLCEPVYGGNPDGIGWQWLEHQPGFPTPATDKMYYKLGKSQQEPETFRRTKA